MQTYNDSLAAELQARIEAQIGERERAIATGNASSFEHYKHQCGMIAGLQLALEISRRAQSDIQKR